MSNYNPSFFVTDQIYNLVSKITEQVEKLEIVKKKILTPELCKQSRIEMTYSSLAMEHTSFRLDQVSSIVNGDYVPDKSYKFKSIKNTYETYEIVSQLKPFFVTDLLAAHRKMTNGTVTGSGMFRSCKLDIFDGDKLVYIAPSPELIPSQIQNLFYWYQTSPLHPLIKSSIFHYEFEYLHPFEKENGRISRMWQTILLGVWNNVFFSLPIEKFLCSRKEEYYSTLRKSNKESGITEFVKLILEVIHESMKEWESLEYDFQEDEEEVNKEETNEISPSIERLLDVIGEDEVSSPELMERLGLRHNRTFRNNYLLPALKRNVIEMTIPEIPRSRSQKYRKRRET